MKVYTCSWLEELGNKFGKKLIYVKQLSIKPTSEYILHIILRGANILLRQADKGYKSKLWRKYM